MLKELSRPIRRLQQSIDAAIVFFVWLAAYYIRFDLIPGALGEGGGVGFFAVLGLLLVAISLYTYNRSDLYQAQRYRAWYREFLAIFLANIQAVLAFIVLLYMLAPDRVSRITIAIYLVAVEFIQIAVRITLRRRLTAMRARGQNLRQVLLVGDGPQVEEYAEKLQTVPSQGLRVVAWLDSGGRAVGRGILERDGTLAQIAEEIDPDMIAIGYGNDHADRIEGVLKDAYNQLRPVLLLPHLTHVYLRNRIDDFEGIPFMQLNEPRISTFDLFIKRLLDLVGALLGLVVLSPLLLLIAIGVRLSSPGPILYGQERVTLRGRTFRMWKFRSMRVDAEAAGAQWARQDDPRRTRFGTFLRRTSLDELPQLWNVLVGQMSVVGPRPERPVFVEKFKNEIPGYMLRHTMKAGITGWAQANGWRGNTSLVKRIEFDIYYIKNWSLALDFEIVLLTLIRGFVDRNAY